MNAPIGSRMFYHGTNDEVQVGDRVRIRRWFRSDLYGTVCYIPGFSPQHRDLEYEDVKQWAIRLDNGTVLVTCYYPEGRFGQPRKNISLVKRGSGGQLDPAEVLDDTEEVQD